MNGEDPFDRARQLREAGVPIAEVERYLQSKLGGITPGHSKFTPEQLVGRADRAVAQSEDELAAAGGHDPRTHKVMGVAASLARDVPAAEAVQAFASSRLNRIPYREALGDIREVESDAGKTGTLARIGGGALSAVMIPGSPVVQGARYGIAHGLAQADPATVEERLHDAAIQGSVGALASKVPGLVGKASKSIASSAAAGADAALLPFSHSARVRTVGRVVGLLRDATKSGAKTAAPAADDAAVSMVEGYQPVGALIDRAPTRVLPFRPSAAEPSSGIVPGDPKAQLAGLLQKNLDEGMAAAERVKGYPIRNDPPSNPALMRRIEEALLAAKGVRATPRRGVTTPPRTVADVLRGGS